MYKLHLIRKYLLKRRIAWVALVAVMLCTAMVLVVVSVMGGWLDTFQNSFHAMTGDVVVSARNPLVGFPYYDEIARRAEREVPGVAAAVPVISSYGLINIGSQRINMVQVMGYPTDIGRVNGWPELLHRQGDAIKRGTTRPSFDLLPDVDYGGQYTNEIARKLAYNRPGMIVTGPVVGITHGSDVEAERTRAIMVDLPVTLTLLPVAPGENVTPQSAANQACWIVDDVKSRVYQLDNNNVYMAFDEVQRDLRMDGIDGGPARCSEVLIKAKPGHKLTDVRDAVARVADAVSAEHHVSYTFRHEVETWEQQQGDFIKAVKHEVVLTTALFGVISLVAVLLIFCIFYMIVVEKTRDIGILKSTGATGGGILSLFLGYGLAIGVVGSGLGVLIAYLFVRNINELHAWLGRVSGIELFSAKTYQFDSIPSKMDPTTVFWVVVVALVAAVLGALVPAVRAAGMNPVDSLRYE